MRWCQGEVCLCLIPYGFSTTPPQNPVSLSWPMASILLHTTVDFSSQLTWLGGTHHSWPFLLLTILFPWMPGPRSLCHSTSLALFLRLLFQLLPCLTSKCGNSSGYSTDPFPSDPTLSSKVISCILVASNTKLETPSFISSAHTYFLSLDSPI